MLIVNLLFMLFDLVYSSFKQCYKYGGSDFIVSCDNNPGEAPAAVALPGSRDQGGQCHTT